MRERRLQVVVEEGQRYSGTDKQCLFSESF
jgi:hypothetical protein